MVERIILSLVLLIASLPLNAQTRQKEPCGTVDYLENLEELYPGLNQHLDELYQESIENTKHKMLHKTPPIDTVFDIPVVFHIVWNNILENIHDSLIISQVDALNDAFNRENDDTVNTREIFKPVAGNARIRFHLATEDPDGNPSNGITRTKTTRTTFYNGTQTLSSDFVKKTADDGKDAWDTYEYLNVWVCDLSNRGFPSLLGYAFPPTNASRWDGSNAFVGSERQGVVVHYSTVGRNNPRWLGGGLNTAEKTAVHEVGHYLGLRHIWGDPRFGQNGCDVDDFIDDTPPSRSSSATAGCSSGKNTCLTANDLPDMLENYMDYSDKECSNMFTKQQVEAMRYNLYNLRKDLGEKTFIQPPHANLDVTTVFPNPTSGAIRIFIKDPEDEEYLDIELIDMLGRTVLELNVVSDYELTLQTGSIAAGNYRIKIASDKRGLLYKRMIFKYD